MPTTALRRTFRGLASTTLFQLLRAPAIFVNSHGDVAQNAIINTHAAFELSNLTARSFDFKQHKSAVFVVQDFIGQLALAHRLSLGHHTALIGHDLREVLGEFRHFIIGRWVYYEDHFVLSLCFQIKPPVRSLTQLNSLIAFKAPSLMIVLIAFALWSNTSATTARSLFENVSSTNRFESEIG